MTNTDVLARRRANLKTLIDTRFGGVQSQFSLAIKRQSNYVSRMVTGAKGIGEKLAREIERDLNLPPGYLDHGSLGDLTQELETVAGAVESGRTVPLVPWVYLAQWASNTNNKTPMPHTERAQSFPGCTDRTFAMRVTGLAMEPEFREGWLIYLDPDSSIEHGHFVVAVPEGRESPILRQLVVEGDTRYLRAINPTHPEPMIPLGGGTIYGRVVYQARAY